MGKLLDSLGLPPLKLKPPADAALAGKPIDLNLPEGYVLPEVPKPTIDFKMPADPNKQVDLFADALAKATDAVIRDKLVRGLRDQIAKIPQPFLKPDEVRKKIDEAIKSLIESKSKELLLKLIEAAVGQKAQKMPDDDKRTQFGPRVEEKDLGEKIFKIELPFPGDKPKPVVRGSFEFRDLARTAKPGSRISFKLLTPHWFNPEPPSTYVVLMEADDFAKNKGSARNLGQSRIETAGPIKLWIDLPELPGRYVFAISSGSGFEGYPVEPIESIK